MGHEDIAKEWFQYADNDLEAAKFLQKMRPIPIEIICYHCQQSCEKYLKGFIALNGGEILKTHDLVALNKECAKYRSDFTSILDECVILTDYGIQTRYPFEMDIVEDDMHLAIKNAENVKSFFSHLMID